MNWFAIIVALSCDAAQVGPPTPPPEAPAKRASADDAHTLRLRIDQNMKAVLELLRRHEVTRSREVQDEILADLDKLLQKMVPPDANPDAANPPPPAGPPPTNDPKPDERPEPADGQGPSGGSRSSSAGSSNKPQPGGGSAGREKKPNENQPGALPQPGGSRRERRSQRSQPQSQDQKSDQAKAEPSRGIHNPRPGENRPGPLPGDDGGSPGANPDQARGAVMSPNTSGKPERFSDLSRDVWGHLPEAMRQEVDHYYRDRFMPRYRELLQQYYSRLAESERKDKK